MVNRADGWTSGNVNAGESSCISIVMSALLPVAVSRRPSARKSRIGYFSNCYTENSSHEMRFVVPSRSKAIALTSLF